MEEPHERSLGRWDPLMTTERAAGGHIYIGGERVISQLVGILTVGCGHVNNTAAASFFLKIVGPLFFSNHCFFISPTW